MHRFKLIENLYTNTKSDWIDKLTPEEIAENNLQPMIIQRFLVMDDRIRVQTRWLDKYTFVLPPKMFISLAWSILPKSQKKPYVKYIKKQTNEEEFDFIISKIRRYYKLSDNDFNANKNRILDAIKKDMVNWFTYFGVERKFWKKHHVDYNQIKKGASAPKPAGLNKWGF
jgi:hypothetical protein